MRCNRTPAEKQIASQNGKGPKVYQTLSRTTGQHFSRLGDQKHATDAEGADHGSDGVTFPLGADEPCGLAVSRQRVIENSHHQQYQDDAGN